MDKHTETTLCARLSRAEQLMLEETHVRPTQE